MLSGSAKCKLIASSNSSKGSLIAINELNIRITKNLRRGDASTTSARSFCSYCGLAIRWTIANKFALLALTVVNMSINLMRRTRKVSEYNLGIDPISNLARSSIFLDSSLFSSTGAAGTSLLTALIYMSNN